MTGLTGRLHQLYSPFGLLGSVGWSVRRQLRPYGRVFQNRQFFVDSDPTEFLIAALYERGDRHQRKPLDGSLERLLERRSHRTVIAMGPPQRLRDHLVNHLHPQQVATGELERPGGLFGTFAVLPENPGTAFGLITE